MMYDFVSYEDSRLTEKNISGKTAAKLYWYHVELFGKRSCHIEQDGIEVDPVDDLGLDPKQFE